MLNATEKTYKPVRIFKKQKSTSFLKNTPESFPKVWKMQD